ncbi:hypothetical protein DIPPA_30872 [Diplonema papillatum]|nr:hypothetical protein DIPPA_30872 [Diplonema papillatum]
MDKSVLKKATSDKSEPTQGHVFRDIARMSFADAKTPQKMADWLVDRLKEAKNPHQMLKTLKVIRHVAASGHSDFQKIMQKYSDDLRPFSQYRGRPDPVLDDKLNQQVRDAGKEAPTRDFCSR